MIGSCPLGCPSPSRVCPSASWCLWVYRDPGTAGSFPHCPCRRALPEALAPPFLSKSGKGTCDGGTGRRQIVNGTTRSARSLPRYCPDTTTVPKHRSAKLPHNVGTNQTCGRRIPTDKVSTTKQTPRGTRRKLPSMIFRTNIAMP